MIPSLDIIMASTLAHAARSHEIATNRPANGLKFEQALYHAVLNAYQWRYATPPDQYNLGLQIHSRTGARYEHDGMFADDDSLYIIEAKWLSRPITREIVGIFVQKLIDTLLGSYSDIGTFAIKPVIVSGNAAVDVAAWRHAIAFGVLVITPDRPTPHEVVGMLRRSQQRTPATQRLAEESELLAGQVWRAFNNILRAPHHDSSTFTLAADQIYDAAVTARLLDHWDECARTAAELRLLASAFPSAPARESEVPAHAYKQIDQSDDDDNTEGD